jgi:hypothetical protein
LLIPPDSTPAGYVCYDTEVLHPASIAWVINFGLFPHQK